MEAGQMTTEQAFEEGARPLKAFLLRFAREKDIRLFLEITRTPPPASPADLDLRIVIPAYMISELKTGFQIGAVLFLPFLVIDLVIASVTLSIGMVQLAAGHGFGAPQDPAVCARGRLEPGDRLADEELLRMTQQAVVEMFRGALMAAFWLSLPVLGAGFVAGIRDQPGADRDFDAGLRVRDRPAPGGVSGRPADLPALDAHPAGLVHNADLGGLRPLCQIAARRGPRCS